MLEMIKSWCEPRYTKEMRINHEICPYCGEWHTSMSCSPDKWFMVQRIQELERDVENYRAYLTIIKNAMAETYDSHYLRQIAREALDALEDGSFPQSPPPTVRCTIHS